jgi:NAD(P)-dependent dehydrogenase (short-subunit alcohol dehydrogenase family)
MSGQVTFDFTGKAALVIGGTSGIGWATARAFARAGAKVATCGLAPPDAPDYVRQLTEDGAPDALFLPLDVRSAPDVERAVATAADRLGGFQVAINNAGIEGRYAPLHEMEPDDCDRLVSVNLRGVFFGLKHEIRHMLEQGVGGAIVNTASTAGIQAIANIGVYSATKHGIIGLTKAAALEQAANGIRVNAVAPGPVATGLLSRMVEGHVPLDVIANSVPMKRISQPEEIAAAILWLSSDAASYVTGETLVVDGGVTQS